MKRFLLVVMAVCLVLIDIHVCNIERAEESQTLLQAKIERHLRDIANALDKSVYRK
jgi:sensor domain CHASE-containing protein